MSKLIVSKHAKTRMKQRASIRSKKSQNKDFKNALKKGLNPSKFQGKFKCYLKNKKSKYPPEYRMKIYKKYIYVYSRNILVTILNIPEKYLPYEDFLYKREEKEVLEAI